ncbi:hypothetical protein [Amycolatopsis sp. YIM 10]|uniref:hypothetical protein n=1 Tax=Amycolatopsis sp. YIM 10 TaxID=2653857 RepID=UPI0012905AF1|nr:hypothetical protein [Amycolatopsis sp. YIM 10]QFU92929.1 hypothetical protein YIM_38870 [Amycolatopsis sp. YIM 10]
MVSHSEVSIFPAIITPSPRMVDVAAAKVPSAATAVRPPVATAPTIAAAEAIRNSNTASSSASSF